MTRPTYTPAQSHDPSQPARPQYNRQQSAISTHSASGRPHPPVYHPPEPKKPKNRKTLLSRIAAQQIAREPNPAYSNGTTTSFNWRSGRPMAGMLEIERSRTRRERTFIGSECAVCEEPLEHTLRGERILQFSCGHVSHEACFYEYIKEFESQYCPTCNAPLGLDTSRGGNVLDLGKATVNESVSPPRLTNPQRNLAVSSAQYHRTMKRGTTINAMVAPMAAPLGSSLQYPGILRPDRRDQAAADQIIAIPIVKSHNRKIHDR